ncbi:MAG: hypothetical protein P8Y54_14530, partial [Xanthomonadales bacterium]
PKIVNQFRIVCSPLKRIALSTFSNEGADAPRVNEVMNGVGALPGADFARETSTCRGPALTLT